MRIALISYEYPPDSGFGGIATYVAQAARLMKSRGHTVEVFASSSHRNSSLEEQGIIVHWINETNRDDFSVIAGHKIAERHLEQAFDVLESPEYFADGRKAIELIPQLPLVVRLHTPSRFIIEMSWSHSAWYPLTRLNTFVQSLFKILINKSGYLPFVNPKQHWQKIDGIEKSFTQKADRVVALCNDLKVFAITKWHCDASVVKVSPNIFEPRAELLALTPREIGKTIGFFGRLERRKGIDLWVKAIPDIIRMHPDVRFRFVGKSQDYTPGLSFETWIKQTLSKYENYFEFLGHVDLDSMPYQYEQVDICVFPSRWENFPYVCLEAMSAAKAVVGSKYGGMAEMMPNNDVGLIIDPFQKNEIVQAVSRLLTNSSERIQMGLNARERVLMNYNSTVIGAQMEQIFLDAIAHKKGHL